MCVKAKVVEDMIKKYEIALRRLDEAGNQEAERLRQELMKIDCKSYNVFWRKVTILEIARKLNEDLRARNKYLEILINNGDFHKEENANFS